MTRIDSRDAQDNLPDLLERASRGEEVVIEREDGLQVQLVIVKPRRQTPRLGGAKGKIKILADFDAPLEEFEEYM